MPVGPEMATGTATTTPGPLDEPRHYIVRYSTSRVNHVCIGIGLLSTTRAAKERSPVLAPGP